MSEIKPDEQACQNCRFSWFWTENKHYYCRRFPPTNFVIGSTNVIGQAPVPITQAYFPNTEPGAWCGEFRRKIAEVGETIPEASVSKLPISAPQTP